jgi:hypothetical protein
MFRPSLWSSGQSSWLQIQRSRVRFPALPDFLRNTRAHAHTRTQTLNIHALSGIRTHDPGFRASKDSTCIRPIGYRDLRMGKVHDKIEALHAAPMTDTPVASRQQPFVLVRVQALQCDKYEVKTLGHLALWAGHTSVASACCVVSLQALTPPHLNPERDPEWHYHHHRISLPFCTFPMPLWLTCDFADKNIPGLGIAHEVKEHPNYGISGMAIFVPILCWKYTAKLVTMMDNLHQGSPAPNYWGTVVYVWYLAEGCIIIALLFRYTDIIIL